MIIPKDNHRVFRGDWGKLRRENSNPRSIYLNFVMKHFDNTYGYSIQWPGIFEFLEMCNLKFFNKTYFQKKFSMYPVLGHLETPYQVPEDNVDPTKITI